MLLLLFSYSYDLTHTLQYNMTPVKNLDTMADLTASVDPWPPGGSGEGGSEVDDGSHVEEASNLTFCAEEDEVSTDGSHQPPNLGTTLGCGTTDSGKVGWGKAPIRGNTPTRPIYIIMIQIGTKVFYIRAAT